MSATQNHIELDSAEAALRLRRAPRAKPVGAAWRWLARRRPALPVLLLFVFGVAAVFGLTYLGGVGLDREAAETSRQEIAAQLDDRTRTLESIAHDYAWWDEAFQNLVVNYSPDWASGNLGPDTLSASYPQVGGGFAISGDGRLLYGFLGSRQTKQIALSEVTGGLDTLVAAARRVEGPEPIAVQGMLRIGDIRYLAGAAIVSPFSKPVPRPADAPVLVILTPLDAKTLAGISQATRATQLHVADRIADGEIGQPLIGADGSQLGALAWVPPRPGQHLVDRLMLPILLVTLLLAALCLMTLDQILKARRAAEAFAGVVAAQNESLQQATELLGLTVDSIDEGIVVMHRDGTVRHWNETYARMWAFPPSLLKVGVSLQQLIEWKLGPGGYEQVEDEPPLDAIWPAGMEMIEPASKPVRRRYLHRTGRLVEARRFELPDGQGQIGVTRDLTEMDRREQALIGAREQAMLANRAKSEFLANVSHELRTPLNAIIGFSEVLEVELYGAIENDRYRSYIRDIRKSGLHLLSLINDILDFSKIEAGKMELRCELCDCTVIGEEAIRQVSHQAELQRLDILRDLPSSPVAILADGRGIFRALLNLLSNAVKFTPEGGRVTLGYRSRPDGTVAFWVSDTGIGIAAADLEKALAPFGQIDSDMARRYRGTGLGLSIVRGIAELHGGSLDVASEVGVGTTVTLVIPDQRAAAPTETARAPVAAK